jgi:hypothetical protein
MSMKPATERPIYVVHLRPEPGVTDPIRMLRAFLKVAWRNFHMRAVDVREIEHPMHRQRPAHLVSKSKQAPHKESLMDMRQFKKPKFLKVEDIRSSGPRQERIAGVVTGQFEKPDLIFESGDKLGLSATNIEILSMAYGFESEAWSGHLVELALGKGEYNREMVDMIILKPLSKSQDIVEQTMQPTKRAVKKPIDPMDEEVNFGG